MRIKDKNGTILKTTNDENVSVEKGIFEMEKKIVNHQNILASKNESTALELINNSENDSCLASNLVSEDLILKVILT